MNDMEKLNQMRKVLQDSLFYKFDDESCTMVIEIDKTAKNLIAHGVTVREMQKPLTVEELKEIYFMREDHVWPHERKPPYLYLDSSIEKNDHLWVAWSIVVDFLEAGYRQYTVESYGKTWRCWANRPTDEERKSAEWCR